MLFDAAAHHFAAAPVTCQCRRRHNNPGVQQFCGCVYHVCGTAAARLRSVDAHAKAAHIARLTNTRDPTHSQGWLVPLLHTTYTCCQSQGHSFTRDVHTMLPIRTFHNEQKLLMLTYAIGKRGVVSRHDSTSQELCTITGRQRWHHRCYGRLPPLRPQRRC
jgi:hypothetical protein